MRNVNSGSTFANSFGGRGPSSLITRVGEGPTFARRFGGEAQKTKILQIFIVDDRVIADLSTIVRIAVTGLKWALEGKATMTIFSKFGYYI
jgi:hypothetical protein